MRYLYGFKWNNLPKYRQPIRPMSEAQARKAYEQRKPVTIGAGPDLEPGTVPTYVLAINGEFNSAGVTTYTPGGSVARVLHYRSEPDDRPDALFLTGVTCYRSEDQNSYSSREDSEIVYYALYRRDGTARRRVPGKVPGLTPREQVDKLYEYSHLDLANHWTPALTWGDWDRLGLHNADYVVLDPANADSVREV